MLSSDDESTRIRINICIAYFDPNSESREQRAARLDKEAFNGKFNGAAEVTNGVESNSHVEATNGHTNGNGAEVKAEAPSSNGNGFRYNKYDGKA
jgi:hypothetical protein